MDDLTPASAIKISGVIPAVVRNGVILCPECGDETVEVGGDGEWVNYQCRTGRALWDSISRDFAAAFDAAQELPDGT